MTALAWRALACFLLAAVPSPIQAQEETNTVSVSFSAYGQPGGPLFASLGDVTVWSCEDVNEENDPNCYEYCIVSGSAELVIGRPYGVSMTVSRCAPWGNVEMYLQMPGPCYEFRSERPGSIGDRFYVMDGETVTVVRLFTNDVQFGVKNLEPDGESVTGASVGGNGMAEPITWSIISSNLGCSIDSATGQITAGTNEGTITVQGTDTNGCVCTGDLELASCASCSSCSGGSSSSPIGTLTAALDSVSLRMSMGALSADQDAGFLVVKEGAPGENIYSSHSLKYPYKRPGVVVVTNLSGLRQVKTPDGLAHVEDEGGFYTVDFYPSTQVGDWNASTLAYDFWGSSAALVRVGYPRGPGTSEIRVEATRDGITKVYEYHWATNGWRLTSGGGLRTESLTIATNATSSTVTRSVFDAQGERLAVSSKRYEVVAGRSRVVEEVVGSGANARTTTRSYNDRGLLELVVRANGSWDRYNYDAQDRVTNKHSSWLYYEPGNDDLGSRTVVYDYSTNSVGGSEDDGLWDRNTPRRISEWVEGIEVANQYNIITRYRKTNVRCVVPNLTWNSNGVLTTTKEYYSEEALQDKLKRVTRNDVSSGPPSEYYVYHTAADGSVTNYVWVGDGLTNVPPYSIQGEIRREVRGVHGELMWRDVYSLVGCEPGLRLDYVDYSEFDANNRATRVQYLDNTEERFHYSCCGMDIHTNREGSVITYAYDALQRRVLTSLNGITTSNCIDAAGQVTAVSRIGSDGSLITREMRYYNDAGELVRTTDMFDNDTDYARFIDADGYWVETTRHPDGGTLTNRFFRDGRRFETTGSATRPVTFQYDDDPTQYSVAVAAVRTLRGGTNEWSVAYSDQLGRTIATKQGPEGSPAMSTVLYPDRVDGRTEKRVDPDGVSTFRVYNALGEVEWEGVDSSGNGVFTLGVDLATHYVNAYAMTNGCVVRQRFAYAVPTDASAPQLVSLTEASVDGLHTWSYDYQTSATPPARRVDIAYPGGGHRYVTNTAPDGTFSVEHSQHGQLLSQERFGWESGQPSRLTGVSFYYDAHGRRTNSTDLRAGATLFGYNDADRLISTTTPAPSDTAPAGTTTQTCDLMGRVVRIDMPGGRFVTNQYSLAGDLTATGGTEGPSVTYAYDSQGRMTNMTTWRELGNASTAAVTSWVYDQARGWLTAKLYANNTGPSYGYTLGGRLKTRTWARGITRTNIYNLAGELAGARYSTGTPEISYGRDRWCRVNAIENGAVAITRTSTVGGLLTGEAVISKQNGVEFSLARTFDEAARLETLDLVGLGDGWVGRTYTYDGGGRLKTVSSALGDVVTYNYVANSDAVAQTAYASWSQSTPVVVVTRQYDRLMRLTNMFSDNTMLDGGESLVCDYDLAGRRTRIADATGAAWFYDYDSAGRLVRGVQKNAQGARSAGRQFEYGFDDIGNRRFARSGGDSWGTGLRQSDYEANALNQYTRRTVPGMAEVQGTADPAAVVTVNNERATRQGAYYRAELQVQNTNGAVYLAVTNLGVLATPPNGDVAVTNTGRLFVPGTPETFEHDLDGNLLSDGRFTYTWDEENQLKSVETATGTPTDWRMRAEFTYDPEGRRAGKSVYAWTNAAWALTKRLVFIYDGWNLLAEVEATGETPWVTRDYGWGLDLSGSMQGAGGVGGLLWIDNWPGTSAVEGHFVQHDIRGNVILLWSDADNAATAQYEYGPFGELLRATGPMAKTNPFQFSTKYHDDESDLLYYGYRYYVAGTGRWINRDPIEESGGLNVCGFVGGDAISRWDILGLRDYTLGTDDPTITPDAGAGVWGSTPPTLRMYGLKALIMSGVAISWFAYPDAADHLMHYFGISGRDQTVRLQQMIDDVGSAKRLQKSEIEMAQAFVESLADGKYSITSGSASRGYNLKSESENWYYAVGGYKAWGKGTATVCKDKYSIEFEYKFYDRYNWDSGKAATIGGVTVTDAFMGEFHRQGSAKEFDMRGSVKKTVKWKKGETPEVSEGWESEGDR